MPLNTRSVPQPKMPDPIIGKIQCDNEVHANQKSPIGTITAPKIEDARWNSGSGTPWFLRTRRRWMRCQTGLVAAPNSMPTKIPKKLRPTCQRLNPYVLPKTNGNAPKKR
ncbi:hypothetical protein RRF57_010747 [Xylaria bambusicola]|uniref:Uncharacterized protein n=1 Tax=Xylaria bambusicola TaxID=326684 RepID=A0AAN7ULP4_9PEZI